MPSVLLPPIGSSAQVQVHPVALFSICDAYIRRNEKQERVIGTLLGTVSNTVIEIKSCYVVPHNESADQVAVDINHHKTMSELHQKVNPQEVIVGWFSTGLSISSSDALIQEFYSKECASPVHLVVDAALSTQRFVTKAYVSRTIGLGEKNLAAEFIEVPCEVLFGEAQRVGLDASVTATSVSVKPPTDAESVTASLHRVQVSASCVCCLAGLRPTCCGATMMPVASSCGYCRAVAHCRRIQFCSKF